MDIDAASRTVQLDMGRSTWSYSLDFNEKCASIDYVVDFLELIRTRNPDCFSRIQYVEQPTHRDLKKNPQNTVHKAAKIKPVVIDESLIDLESLLLARDQGYSGIALKACKGQTGSLLMAAAAQKLEMFLCVQDLTCIGHNFLHSASLAAHIPTVAAIEGNGRQYCPLGNQQWAQRYPDVFQPVEGRIATQELNGLGLGF
jgi:L-alanine-DL-glutamate epimerase-like enolase superfamily enzyme